jgi:hypothetical protein
MGREDRRLTTLFLVPMRRPEDVRPHLAQANHWKPLRSACELAKAWFEADGVPKAVRRVLNGCEDYHAAQVVHGSFEHQTDLRSAGAPSQTDLLLVASIRAGLAVIAVEGKVDEGFGETVREWNASPSKRRPLRLTGLCDLLGLPSTTVDTLRYQLLHRTAAALLEAQRYRTGRALMLVHSFTDHNPTSKKGDSFEDFQAFAATLGAPLDRRNSVSEAVIRHGIHLRLAWVADKPVSPGGQHMRAGITAANGD